RKLFVVLHTIFRKGSKYVYIWSPCEIRNLTSAPLQIRIQYDGDALRSAQIREKTKFDLATLKATKDFGIIQAGESVPVPLSIDPKYIDIQFAPQRAEGWTFTKSKSVAKMIETSTTCRVTSRCLAASLSSTTSSLKSSSAKSSTRNELVESFFMWPKLSKDLITVMIQTPLVVVNLFPFEIVVHLKIEGHFDWQQKIEPNETKHVLSDFSKT
ncbi:hypothetical protein RFI_19875, partial [Reticulomyxa filosa]